MTDLNEQRPIPAVTGAVPAPAEVAASVVHGRGALHDFARRVRGNRGAMAALVGLGLLVLLALVGEAVAPRDAYAQDLQKVLLPPGSEGYLLGTDQLGRDILSRLVVGTRISLLAVFQSLAVAVVIGVPFGFVAGFRGGRFDAVVMRVNDAVMSFPGMLLAIALVGVLGPSLRNAMLAIGLVFAPRFLRLVRGVVMGLKEETYIEASRSIGTKTGTIIRRHVFPNALSPLTVQLAVTAGYAMLAEAGLSFLGLGAQPPDVSWGGMIRDGFLYFGRSPWLGIFPGLCITLAVFIFLLLGDGLRDALGREERRER